MPPAPVISPDATADESEATLAAPVAEPPARQPSELSGDPLELYDDNGNRRITCAEARRHGIAPVPRSHPAYRYLRDVDGVVCE